MCTTFLFPTETSTYAGRTLDFDCHFNEQVILTPRLFPYRWKNGSTTQSHEAVLGMGMVADNFPLYAEAINESGLYMAGLYFQGYAHYIPRLHDGTGISPVELIPYILTHHQTVASAREELVDAHLTNEPINPNLPLSPLHWFLADKTGTAIVIEQTAAHGLVIYDNPAKVLTNNPEFSFHLENLKRYQHLSPTQPVGDPIFGAPTGRGWGQLGLPGDPTPASRFVRAAYLVAHADKPATTPAAVNQVFHILDSVKLVAGSTKTESGVNDTTLYAAVLNLEDFEYYYTTEQNRTITRIAPDETAIIGREIRTHSLQTEPRFTEGQFS